MIVRNVPLISFIADPRILRFKKATTIVTRGDAYGKERMRLTVPWQMTGSTSSESGQPPTSFANISAPYTNPADVKEGKFGVTAWVEYAGKHYFELDYHSGQFLWCRCIMD
jgi:hypothetical protein